MAGESFYVVLKPEAEPYDFERRLAEHRQTFDMPASSSTYQHSYT